MRLSTPWYRKPCLTSLGLVAVLVGSAPVAAAEGAAEDASDDRSEEPGMEVVSVDPSPVAEGSDPTPAVYRVDGEALERPGLGMEEVLARVPGLQTRRGGGAADLASLSVRGASSAQTPIYLGGVRLNDDLTGSVDLSTLPLWMLREVSVYRGNAPMVADELGLGGAVMLEPRLAEGVGARAALGLGSFGERMGRGAISLGDGKSGAALALRHRAGDGDFPFVDDAGTRFDDSDDVTRERRNADYRELDVWTLGRLRLAGGTLTTFVNAFERQGGAPGLQLNGAERARSRQRRIVGGASGVGSCARDGSCTLVVDLGALVTRYRLSDPDRELGPARQVDQAGERLSERFRLLANLGGELQLGFGGLLEQQSLRLDTDAGVVQRARRQRVRPELSGSWHATEALSLAAVAAVECHGTEALRGSTSGRPGLGDGEACGVLEPVGRLGARWRLLEELSLFGNLGRYVRVPTLGELYGVSAVVLGNDELRAEDGVSLDLGATAEGRLGPVSLWGQGVGFSRFAFDLVAYRRSSFSAIRPYNAESARTLGAELAGGLTAWETLDAGLAVTLLDPRDTSEGGPTRDLVPFLARLVVAPSLGVTSPPWETIALDAAALRLRYLHRSSRVADPAGLIVLREQNLLDLDASLAFADMVVVRGRIANLIDQRTVDLVGYPLPGRSYHALVEGRL